MTCSGFKIRYHTIDLTVRPLSLDHAYYWTVEHVRGYLPVYIIDMQWLQNQVPHNMTHDMAVVSACGHGLLTVEQENWAPYLGLNHMIVYIQMYICRCHRELLALWTIMWSKLRLHTSTL